MQLRNSQPRIRRREFRGCALSVPDLEEFTPVTKDTTIGNTIGIKEIKSILGKRGSPLDHPARRLCRPVHLAEGFQVNENTPNKVVDRVAQYGAVCGAWLHRRKRRFHRL